MPLRQPAPVLRWTVGILLGVVALAWFTSPNPAGRDDDGDPFTGRWLVNGVDPFGTEYSGSLTIAREDAGYRLDWIVNGALLGGSGRRSGDELVSEWAGSIAGREVTGTATHVVDGDSISGVTTVDGDPGRGTESGEVAR